MGLQGQGKLLKACGLDNFPGGLGTPRWSYMDTYSWPPRGLLCQLCAHTAAPGTWVWKPKRGRQARWTDIIVVFPEELASYLPTTAHGTTSPSAWRN